MVDRIGGSGGLASTAIEAALRRQADLAAKLRAASPGSSMPDAVPRAAPGIGAPPAPRAFASELSRTVDQLDGVVKQGDQLHLRVLAGDVEDLHEVAAQLKQTDLAFKFAMATRNKLVEAYREIMRMGV